MINTCVRVVMPRQKTVLGGAVLSLHISSIIIVLLVSVTLARFLGLSGFGVYSYYMAITIMLIQPCTLGMPNLLIREISVFYNAHKFSLMLGILLRSLQIGLLVSVSIAAFGFMLGLLLIDSVDSLLCLGASLALLPLFVLLELFVAILLGIRKPVASQCMLLLREGTTLVLIFLVGYGISSFKLTPLRALIIYGCALLISVILFGIFVWRKLPKILFATTPNYETRRWLKSALPMVVSNSMSIVIADLPIILLGLLTTPSGVGLFRVAQKFSRVLPMGLRAVNVFLGPKIAGFLAVNEIKAAQQIISKGIVAAFSFAVLGVILIALVGRWGLLTFVGAEYESAYGLLLILCLSQLIFVGFGPIPLIMDMANLEKKSAIGIVCATICSAFISYWLIYYWGNWGAAWGAVASILVWKTPLFLYLWRKIGIVSSPILFK